MTHCIAFLRAINVGGHTVKMETLRSLFSSWKLRHVETFIASGNVLFESGEKDLAALEQRLERELPKALGFPVATFLRTREEVAGIAERQPFPPALFMSAQAFNVGFMKAPLSPEGLNLLATLNSPVDAFHAEGRELYWLCQVKQSDSTFSNAVFERALRAQATLRGRRTLQQLADKCAIRPASRGGDA